jgi:hypothetical protein
MAGGLLPGLLITARTYVGNVHAQPYGETALLPSAVLPIFRDKKSGLPQIKARDIYF